MPVFDNDKVIMNVYSRLYWQCRRGMRELDFVLQDFLEAHYEALPEADKHAFQELLNYPDPLLLEYVMGRMQPSDRAIADVVSKIRNAITN